MPSFSRRAFVIGAGTALAAGAFARPHVARAAAPFVQPPLPFEDTALAPTIGQQTVQLHYGKHHASYYANLNKLVEGKRYAAMDLKQIVFQANLIGDDRAIFNNAGQAYNHELYWDQFKPGGAKAPSGKLAEKIQADLGGLDKMKEELVKVSTGVFGSGWGWIAQDDKSGKLELVMTAGGDNPLTKLKTALLGIDVWEHAYYLDYQNRRADHVKAVLDTIVNWDVVGSRVKG